MLSKLLKHEWLSTWKVPTALFIYLCIITLLGCTSFLSPLWKSDNEFVGVLAVFSLMLYILSLFSISIAIFVFFVVRFYRSMYTNEGYLMHTLPVKPWQHIVSKGLIFCSWSLINVIAIFLSIISLVSSAVYSVTRVPLHELWAQLQIEFPQFLSRVSIEFQEEMGMNFITYILLIIVSMLVQTVFAVLMIYASISIGQTFNRHKVIASFIAYAAINMILQLVNSLIQMPMLIFRIEDSAFGTTLGDIMTPSLWISLVTNLICIVIFYLVTEFIMRKKLNLN